MSPLATPLLFASTPERFHYQAEFWTDLYNRLGDGGRFWLDIAQVFGRSGFMPRAGEWAMPWDFTIAPGFEMPEYDSRFSMTFAEVTDRRAADIRELIAKTDAPIALYYSGGIDSTVCLAALIRNLTAEELAHVHLCMSLSSLIENPLFFEKLIKGRFQILDSSTVKYGDLIERGFYTITADQGDCIFGTELGLQLYYSYGNILERIPAGSRELLRDKYLEISSAETHFSLFADLIIAHWEQKRNPGFGRMLYERIAHNIETAQVPIHSLHDFYWWIIFNLKYIHCAFRSVMFYFGAGDRRTALHESIINWFNHADYQRWSMVNNNNGEKIRGVTATSYKWAARVYIHSVDKNEWYLRHKLKLASLDSIFSRNESRLDNILLFGMDSNYDILRLTDPEVKGFVEQSLLQYR